MTPKRETVSKIGEVCKHRTLEVKNTFSQDLTIKLCQQSIHDTASSVNQRIALEIKAKELMYSRFVISIIDLSH